MGLPYYFPDVKIIDLNQPAKLASLKECLLSNSTNESIVKLKERNIRYLLINPYVTQGLDSSLNFTLSSITQSSELVSLSQTFGDWKLYIVDPNDTEES